MNRLVPPKIVIDENIREYIDGIYPENYEWHFFDVTYDIDVSSVFGICMGETEYGKFVAVGSATRNTLGEALKKVIQELGQAIPYFRWVLVEKKGWEPSDNFNKLMSFEDHSVFYLKKQQLWGEAFNDWILAKESENIEFNECVEKNDIWEIKRILRIFKEKGYNVLFKDLTTVDVNQLGFKSVKIFIPQLIQMSGAYPFYYNGAKRLYEVPEKMGYQYKDYTNLNKFPHPFP